MEALDGFYHSHDVEEHYSQLKEAVIMMVDDEPIMMELVQAYLEEEGYRNFITLNQSSQALQVLNRERPDVLLLDLNMPGVEGFDILDRIRACRELRHMPVIVLTSSTDPESKLKALALGAADFLAKPVDQSELMLRIRNTLTVKAYHNQLAFYDELTGLPNRKLFLDRLDWAIRRAARGEQQVAVIHIGLNKFKQVNESLGPQVGDMLLKLISKRLLNCVQNDAVLNRLGNEELWRNVSRLGGDEFSILVPQVPHAENIGLLARSVLDALGGVFEIDGHEVCVSASMGIAVYPGDGAESDALIKHAGVAAGHAKQRGGSSYQFYSKEINGLSRERFRLEADLRRALEREEFELYYQPKIQVSTGRLIGMEALLRWHHPRDGMILPHKFIPLAEESDLIVPIGDWVIDQACRQNRQWQSEYGIQDLKIAVNVSAQQLRRHHLSRSIKDVLSASGMLPDHLMVEITESMVIEDTENCVQILYELRDHGVHISLDDFGTGYSSLSYLKRLPIDELKVDRSFLVDFQGDDDSSAIFKAIIALSHSLDLTVVAEGVETEQQLHFLREERCDLIQGHYFSKPLSANDFLKFVGQRRAAV